MWFDDANREHYEAQLIRVDGEPALEIGFHVEYPKVTSNDEVLHRLRAKEETWRQALGDAPEAGAFIGAETWRRVSEVWEPPDPDDQETVARLALRERAGATEIELTQGPFATEARRELHEAGWTDTFARLARHLTLPT